MANDERELAGGAPSVQDLARNGCKQYAWRLVDGAPKLVLVGLRFTVPAYPDEDASAFEQRALRYCVALSELGFPVVTMEIEQRAHQHKQPWAVFECQTSDT